MDGAHASEEQKKTRGVSVRRSRFRCFRGAAVSPLRAKLARTVRQPDTGTTNKARKRHGFLGFSRSMDGAPRVKNKRKPVAFPCGEAASVVSVVQRCPPCRRNSPGQS